ncbi:MAG: cytochrome c biogenesis protein CcsA [bacterium]
MVSWFYAGLLVVLLILLFNWTQYLVTVLRQPTDNTTLLIRVSWGAYLLFTCILVLRGIQTGQFPVDGRADIFLTFSWALLSIFLGLNLWYPLRFLGTTVIPISGLFIVFPLIPDTFSLWGAWIHILLIMIAYGAFTVSFLLAVGYLRAEHQLREKEVDRFFFLFPSLQTIDRALHLSTWIGTACIVAGIIIGMVQGYALQQLSTDWFLDPNIMGALITTLIYGTILVIRERSLFTNRRIAYLTIAGFVIIVLVFTIMGFVPRMHPFF